MFSNVEQQMSNWVKLPALNNHVQLQLQSEGQVVHRLLAQQQHRMLAQQQHRQLEQQQHRKLEMPERRQLEQQQHRQLEQQQHRKLEQQQHRHLELQQHRQLEQQQHRQLEQQQYIQREQQPNSCQADRKQLKVQLHMMRGHTNMRHQERKLLVLGIQYNLLLREYMQEQHQLQDGKQQYIQQLQDQLLYLQLEQ